MRVVFWKIAFRGKNLKHIHCLTSTIGHNKSIAYIEDV